MHSREVAWPVPSVDRVLSVLVHIAGDMLTVGGIPAPLVWLRDRISWGLRLFRTGDAVETLLIGPLLWLLVLGLLVTRLNHPGGVPTEWTHQLPTHHH